ncbi:MAG: spermidine synthase, partial [Firmicutes bacterium]|nr:spermidine synthase [Bacillota bacterium]
GENTINTYLADTISTLFSEVYTIDVTYSSNRELFASNNKDMMDVFRAGYMHLAIMSDTSYNDVFLMSDTVYKGMERYVPGDRVMTDDKAPVELLSMQAIDGIIYDEVAYFKDIYNEKGIKGVIDALR